MFCLIVRKFYSFMDLDEVIMPSPIEFPPGNGLGWRGFFFLLFPISFEPVATKGYRYGRKKGCHSTG